MRARPEETFKAKRERIAKESADVEVRIRWVETFGVFLICIGFVLAAFGVCQLLNGVVKLGDLGSFLQGAVGAPFALAGAAFVYVAFLGQKKQSLIQESQIAYNEEQIAVNRKELEAQRVEQTFFLLLQKYHDIVTSLDLYRNDPKVGVIRIAQGRECFEVNGVFI